MSPFQLSIMSTISAFSAEVVSLALFLSDRPPDRVFRHLLAAPAAHRIVCSPLTTLGSSRLGIDSAFLHIPLPPLSTPLSPSCIYVYVSIVYDLEDSPHVLRKYKRALAIKTEKLVLNLLAEASIISC